MRLLSCAALVALTACPKKVEPPSAPAAPAAPVDRIGAMPAPGPEVAFSLPQPTVGRLKNGTSTWTIPTGKLPLVTVVVGVPVGAAADARGKEGTAALASTLMAKAAGKRDSQAFAAEVERLGVQLSMAVDHESSELAMSCRADVLPAALDLVADVILRPRFDAADVERERELAIAGLEQALDEPAYVASRAAHALWFGKDHRFGRPADGTTAGLERVTKKDLLAWYKAAWGRPPRAAITVAGAVTAEAVTTAMESRLGRWTFVPTLAELAPQAVSHTDAPYYLVDKPGSAQTGFFLVFPGSRLGAPEVAPLRIGTIALGGTFTSRLNALLREKKGYTYGVRAGLEPWRALGMATIRTRIRADVTAPALADLLGELEAIRKGVDEAEIKKARGAYRQELVEAMGSVEGVAATFAEYHAAGLGPESLGAELATVSGVEGGAIAAAMAAYDRSHAVAVLVGDRAVIEGPLRAAGFTALQGVEVP
jgi:predicted Zn-dependent peptidase